MEEGANCRPAHNFEENHNISEISELSNVHRRHVFVVSSDKLFGNDNVGSFTGMVRIPEHVLVAVGAHARLWSAWNYPSKLASISTTCLTCCCESCTVSIILQIVW
ncbi:unnamed protein product [Camellia sinensis]